MTWHECLGHHEVGMMRKILGNIISHNLNTTGKLIVRLSPLKIQVELVKFLERIQGDICGPI
jgi:hypothetical protein